MTGEYTFEFETCYFNTDNFKHKQVDSLLAIINTTRIHDFINFDSYANFRYNDWDDAHRYPTVSSLDEYNRSKTNCLIFNIVDKRYTDLYDKVFIYYSAATSAQPRFGFVFFNTSTGKMHHKYFIDYLYDDLIISLTRTFYAIDFNKKIKPLMNKDIPGQTKLSNSNFYKQKKLEKYNELGLNIKIA